MICPNCNEEITYLHGYSKEEIRYLVEKRKNGLAMTKDQIVDTDEFNWVDFECPYCSTVLAHTEEEAEKLLTPTQE